MQLVANGIFLRCVQEQRTYVGTGDFEFVRRYLCRERGRTNFAHFWEDVPVLDPIDKKQTVAKNCLFLACIARLGTGEYESLDDLYRTQEQLGLEAGERLATYDLRNVENGLLGRGVLNRLRGSAETNYSHTTDIS